MTEHPDYVQLMREINELTDSNSVVIVAPPGDPMKVARQFVAEHYIGTGDALLLRHHRNTFHRYLGDHWPEDHERRVESQLWQWLEHAVYEKVKGDGEGEPVLFPFQPNKNKIANVLEALKAIGHITEGVQPPVWLNGSQTTPISAGQFVPLTNGILEFTTRTLRPHTPEFFELHVLTFAYEPDTPPPTRWLAFLTELWKDDEESKQALQEWFGYVLANTTDLQKMFLIVGPKRSGKGTIGRVLQGLLGKHNVAGPTLSGLTGNFGLQALIGKPLAILSDARLGSRSDNLIAVERLLSISGEDTLTVDRKYKDPWTGQLPTRFMMLTNELPRFSDSSGALASRFVTTVLTTSFFGRENPALTNELLKEASSIFNWALVGLDRLRERGHFITPASAAESQRHLEHLASPVGAFIRDRCSTGPNLVITKNDLWTAWKEWSAEEGLTAAGTKANLLKNVYAAVPGARPTKPRDGGGGREPSVTGLALLVVGPTMENSPDHPDQGAPVRGNEPLTDLEKTAQPSGWSGWSGQTPIVSPTPRNPATIAGEPSAPKTVVGPTVEKSLDHPDHPTCDHPEQWLARDGLWRCLICEPPAFAAEVVNRRETA